MNNMARPKKEETKKAEEPKKEVALTPATLENMPVTDKMKTYEEILSNQTKLRNELEEVKDQILEVLKPLGKSFSDYYGEKDLHVYKKRQVDEKIYEFATRLGRTVGDLIANGKTAESSLEEFIGAEAYGKLKLIADEHSIQQYGKSGAIDKPASEHAWKSYSSLIKHYNGLKGDLLKEDRRLEEAEKYLSYVTKLSDVANKTAKLYLRK